MRAACKLASRVLNFAGTLVKPSITTNEIDMAGHHMIVEAGAYPSPLGYGGFPKSICTSVNECACHGLPDSTQLQNGDIITIDVNVFLNKAEYAISAHYDHTCVWEEVLQNKCLNKYNHTAIDGQFYFYQFEGL
ncbi:hypothetical protein CFC21_005462 [Triticum aestivum]|uniref:Peptidase M24 domain-containing protein n=2 Tax=Triticum aestivum TaxID=4565 RepID=A0A9R1IPF1_WHEAT|nr:methionine aminopeptidase 1B, chloroplastic-like [Triticum dicoccoides]KAF6987857.1 hypothetical protein CFC21_005462 [Triticum aestivum]